MKKNYMITVLPKLNQVIQKNISKEADTLDNIMEEYFKLLDELSKNKIKHDSIGVVLTKRYIIDDKQVEVDIADKHFYKEGSTYVDVSNVISALTDNHNMKKYYEENADKIKLMGGLPPGMAPGSMNIPMPPVNDANSGLIL